MAVGHGRIGEPGDQDGGRLPRGVPLGADRKADGPDRRGAALLEQPEHLVIAPCRQQRQLLQRIGDAGDLDEADKVAGDTGRPLDQEGGLPARQRPRPVELEQLLVTRFEGQRIGGSRGLVHGHN